MTEREKDLLRIAIDITDQEIAWVNADGYALIEYLAHPGGLRELNELLKRVLAEAGEPGRHEAE